MNTNYFLDCVSGNVFGTKTSPAIPTAYYIGLSTTAPSGDGSGATEPSGDSGYSRVELTDLGEPDDGIITNTQAINFPESTGSWGTVTHFVIYDSPTVGEGNLLMYGQLTASRVVEAGTIMTIKQGSLTLSVQNPA